MLILTKLQLVIDEDRTEKKNVCLPTLLFYTYSFPETISKYTDLFSIWFLIRKDFPNEFIDYILKILFFLYELSSY